MKADSVHLHDERHPSDRRTAPRPKRTQTRGPLGFGHVMRLVQRDRSPEGDTTEKPLWLLGGGERDLEEVRRGADTEHSWLNAESATALTAQLMTAAAHGDPHALEALAGPATAAERTAAEHFGAMTPSTALDVVVDEARKLEIEQASKELVIELEPEHLGPLVVRITVDRGRIRADMRAREAQAVARLRSGQSKLQGRLEGIGFHSAEVTVEEDADL